MIGIASRASAAVARRFATLLGRIQPLATTLQRADQRQTAIRTRLQRAFRVPRFVRVGSLWKGTGISSYSDLDLFVVLSRDEVRWGSAYITSSTLLQKIRSELVGRFPATAIRKDGQAVSVSFAGGRPGADVVPAVFEGAVNGGFPAYLIPDGTGSWVRTAPDYQKRYFDDEDVRCGGKLRRVIQTIKWWARARVRPIPLLSYHLEMLLASGGVCRGARGYAGIVADAFGLLATRGGAGLNDPLGVSGRIPAAGTQAQQEELARAAAYAWNHARAAVRAEGEGWLNEAVRQWRIVLATFPP
jgi:hypothetical protein